MDGSSELAQDVAVHMAVGAEAGNLALIARRHGLSLTSLRARVKTDEFRRELEMARASMGYARKAHAMRCASISEMMLEKMVDLANDVDTAPSVKVKIWELIRADAGLAAKDEVPVGNAVQINIYKTPEPGGAEPVPMPVLTTEIGNGAG